MKKCQRFRAAINKANEKVVLLSGILRGLAKTNPELNQLKDDLLYVMMAYEPKTYNKIREICELNIAKQNWDIDSQGLIRKGSAYADAMPDIYGQCLEDGSCIYQYASPGDTALSRVEGFLGDHFEIIKQFFYTPNRVYYNLNEHQKCAELGSTFADFPSEVGEVIYKEFYQYMHEFFNNEINDDTWHIFKNY